MSSLVDLDLPDAMEEFIKDFLTECGDGLSQFERELIELEQAVRFDSPEALSPPSGTSSSRHLSEPKPR
jgi:chemotaxis protein histidine kinase CheA